MSAAKVCGIVRREQSGRAFDGFAIGAGLADEADGRATSTVGDPRAEAVGTEPLAGCTAAVSTDRRPCKKAAAIHLAGALPHTLWDTESNREYAGRPKRVDIAAP